MAKLICLTTFLIFMAFNIMAEDVFKKNNELVQVGTYYQSHLFHPYIFLEAESETFNRFSVWVKLDYRRNMVKNNWSENGYFKKPFFGASEHMALQYKAIYKENVITDLKIGIGGNLDKMYLGPLIGINVYTKRFYAKLYGIYSLCCKYKSDYPPELIDACLNKQNIVYIKDFDPNSYIKLEAAYKINSKFSIGILSERCYLNGFFLDYQIFKSNKNHFKNIEMRIMSGINSNSTNNCYGFALNFRR